MDDVLVLWDIDGTLINAGGVGRDLYEVVFRQLFGRPLATCAPMAGRTDRAIILETLTRAGVPEPRRYVDPFIAGLAAHARSVGSAVAERGRALPGAAEAVATLAAARYLAAHGGLGSGAGDLVGVGAGSGACFDVGGSGGRAAGTAAGGLPAGGLPAAGIMAGDGGAVDQRGVRPENGGGRRVYQSVLTGNIRAVAEVKLAALGLRNGLDLCIGAYGDDHEDRTELVQVARRRAAGVHDRSGSAFAGTTTVVIGDTPLDIAAALAAGARAVGVATGSHAAADLTSAGAHAVLPSLADTPLVLDAIFG
jgi:phosphoglycolate phosphatase-like HAD superfamily hydrolase